VTEIFTSVDKDGDLIQITDDADEESDLGISVRQDGRASVAYLTWEQYDEMVTKVAKHRWAGVRQVEAVVTIGETDYDRRLNAARDAKVLMGQLFGPPKANDLVLVTEYLLHGMPEVKA